MTCRIFHLVYFKSLYISSEMKNKTAFSLLFFFICFFICFLSINENLFAQKRKTPPRRTVAGTPQKILTVKPTRDLPPEMQRRLNAFYFAWETIKNNYFDQTFSGLNWENIKKEYEPRVLNTKTDKQLHDLLQEMINRLNRSHFVVIPPEVYQAIEKAKAKVKAKENRIAAEENESESEESGEDNFIFEADENAKFGIGVELRLINNQFVITRVESNSAAEKAGLKTGYAIEKINDVALGEMLVNIEIYYASFKNIKRHLPAQVVGWFLNGGEDSFVEVSYLDETEQLKNLKIRREKLTGETISIGKNFPEQYLKFETASLNDDVGYVKFNLFALPVVEKFCASLTQLKDKKAIIIDLRGNTGGILGTLIALSGMLTDKSVDLGTQIYKIGSENMVASSKAKNFKGRVIFLVDNQTVSAAEVFAAALQENNRALVIGEKTAGEALPSVSVELPTGAFLLYPIANFKTRNGNFLEGKGVEPNYVVALDRKSLLAGKDSQLEKALGIIKDDKIFPKPIENVLTIRIIGNSPPPPPPPPAKPKGKTLAEVTIKLPPYVPPKETPAGKDAKSLQVISEFINKIGGEEALGNVSSYTLKGKTEIGVRGSKAEFDFNGYRRKPDKYAEVLESETVGQIREIYTAKNYLLQSDYGIIRELPIQTDTSKIEILSPINNLLKKDFYKSLVYQGSFDRQGKKAHVIEAKTEEGLIIALAFDVESKLLVGYVGQFYVVSFGDYRQIGNLLLPFQIERENLMKITLNEILLNPTIDESNFSKKENCFDKAN